jgi:3-methyladenine DNA glycosylase AlkD
MITSLREDLQKLANPEKAKILQRFFKTGKGEYGEGDVFLGINAPSIKEIASKYKNLEFSDIEELLKSKIHEERIAALLILINRFSSGNDKAKKEIYEFYLVNTKYINNWDLVDLSAAKIVGSWLADKEKDVLYKLALSENVWERRIAIISTFDFIRKNKFRDTIDISKILLKDEHDLIHKAAGWMLREVGKREQDVLENFLKEYHKQMPRTTLRYAIEKFDPDTRRKYLRGEI